MQIAIDARELCGRPTGVGRYLSHLLDAWGALPAARPHHFMLCAPAPLNVPVIAPGAHHLHLSVSVLEGSPGTVWEQLRLPSALRRNRFDVLFSPAYTTPLVCTVPTVLTIHDVSFAAHPEWYGWREGLRLRWLARLSGQRAATVLTDSEFSKREIVARLRIPERRIRVIRLGIGQPRGVGRPPAAGPPVILFVGSLFNRRRLPDLIAAFKEVVRTHPDARLEIVGENRTFPHQDLEEIARRIGIADRVSLCSYVSDEELAALYAQARVFAFLSEYEGFGLTPLEALAAGVPIVVLDTPIARELYGDAAAYVRPGDIAGTAVALTSMLEDSDQRRRLLDRARSIVAGFSWAEAARRTLEELVLAGSVYQRQ
ncbi:MAG: glycosyltransferase family 4 protein [Acidobacteria bacterium]|nr:glycosyltransferase family 4 protein [Acidobacteriota bacterium]